MKDRSPKRMYWAQISTMRRQHIFDAGQGGVALCTNWQLFISPEDPGVYQVAMISQADVEVADEDCAGCWTARRRLEKAGLWQN